MKLYIPTTHVNLNNILSTESMSPRKFYSARGYGYKDFTPVAPNSNDELILLYKDYPLFDIHDECAELYPMVIEIEVDRLEDLPIHPSSSEEIYFSKETLYFSPSSTTFYFSSEGEMLTSINATERSAETKLVALYSNSFAVKSDYSAVHDWCERDLENLNLPPNLDWQKHARNDRRLDRVKGFMYGYIIGANSSVNKADIDDYINLVKKSHDLSDALTAYCNNRKYGSYLEKSREILSDINQIFGDRSVRARFESEYAPRFSGNCLTKSCEAEFNSSKIVSNLIDVFRKEGCYDIVARKGGESMFHGSTVAALQEYIFKLNNRIDNMFPKSKIDSCLIPEYCNAGIRVPEEDFPSHLATRILNKELLAESLVESRQSFVRRVGEIFRELAGDKWNDSEDRRYINDLMLSLGGGTEFTLDSSASPVLQALAVFAQKGSKADLDDYVGILRLKGIGDFRVALAFWGLIFGFSAMTKMFVNKFYSDSDQNYTWSIYRHIHKNLHGVELHRDFEPRDLPHLNKRTTLVELSDSLDSERHYQGKNGDEVQADSVIAIFESGEVQRLMDEIQGNPEYWVNLMPASWLSEEGKDKMVLRAIQGVLTSNGDIEQKLKDIAAIDGMRRSTRIYKKIKDRLMPEINLFSAGKEDDSCGSGAIPLYQDDGAYDKVDEYIPKAEKENVREELKWIQEVHRVGGYEKKAGEYVHLRNHSNAEVIRHFNNNARRNSAIERNVLKAVVTRLAVEYP